MPPQCCRWVLAVGSGIADLPVTTLAMLYMYSLGLMA
ncbi:hypothetical protein AB7M16_000309 [Bradyrhizobium sp. USDA 372]